jgi:hypothetical protein
MSNFATLDALNQSTPTNLDALDSRMAFASDGQQIAQAADSKLFVRFYVRSVRNEAKSLEANRAIFEDQVYINIKIPGDKNNDVNRVAFPEDIMRFPQHYERFKKNQEQVVGTPLTALPFLTEAQIMEYATVYIKTVEQLAELSDVNAQKMMGSLDHKQKAQAWLDSFKSADALRAEFSAKADEQAKQIAELQERLAKLMPKGAPAK